MERIQKVRILKDLSKKMVILVGPRQVGKTHLSKIIAKKFQSSIYLNWDQVTDRSIILKQNWLSQTDLLILDEIHKMPKWKNYLKGLYDTKPSHLKILVTGSARLEVFKKAGDSLAGRYFPQHLFPLSPSELTQLKMPVDLKRLMVRGGFPEPYLAETDEEAARWRLQYIDSLITIDVLDFEKIHDLSAIRTIFELLRSRVGSPVSYESIARDVQLSPNSVKKYIKILESLYVIFRIYPYSKNIARSLLKTPKIYFFDTALVKKGVGEQFENLTAVNLYKHMMAKRDYVGENITLHYLRDKEKREVDFALAKDDLITEIIEAKYAESSISAHLIHFSKHYNLKATQIVYDIKKPYKAGEITVIDALTFFIGLDL